MQTLETVTEQTAAGFSLPAHVSDLGFPVAGLSGFGRISGSFVPQRFELIARVRSYNPNSDEALLSAAYIFAVLAHGKQRRASGLPYVSHPKAVAYLLADKQLDDASIAAGLLHDTVEDTKVTLADISNAFGAEIGRLVDGVTRLTRIKRFFAKTRKSEKHTEQAEHFRCLLLAMSRDIRVVMVKLADRLHNMRTLGHLKSVARQNAIALETQEFFAPLAARFGIVDWQEELEDLAFGQLNPVGRHTILVRLKEIQKTQPDSIRQITNSLQTLLEKRGIKSEITGRIKRPYSIWKKQQSRSADFAQITDITAFRIVVDSANLCYQALGAIHRHYQSVPGRFKDYVSLPKPNGYRSLHTTIIGPNRRKIEVQIRSKAMDKLAKFGVAAHWKYKQSGSLFRTSEHELLGWFDKLVENVQQIADPEEFLEQTRLDLYIDQVFVFTPRGKLFALPRNATAIDFAFAVHTEIGLHCAGAKINGRSVPMHHVLRNGDQVEIVTSPKSVPAAYWVDFAQTGRARATIRRYLAQRQRVRLERAGREVLNQHFARAKYAFSEEALGRARLHLRCENNEKLFIQVSNGQFSAEQVLNAAWSESAKPRANGKPQAGTPASASEFSCAECCMPVPGDAILGIAAPGSGVVIHRKDCLVPAELFGDTPERWLSVEWPEILESGAMVFRTRLTLDLLNEPGALASICAIIGKEGVNICNIILPQQGAGMQTAEIDVEVSNRRACDKIAHALDSLPVVTRIARI